MRWLLVGLALAGCLGQPPVDSVAGAASAVASMEWAILSGDAAVVGAAWDVAAPVETAEGPKLFIEVEGEWAGDPSFIGLQVFHLGDEGARYLGGVTPARFEMRVRDQTTLASNVSVAVSGGPYMLDLPAAGVGPGSALGFVAVRSGPGHHAWTIHPWTQEPPASARSPDPDLRGRLDPTAGGPLVARGTADAAWLSFAFALNNRILVTQAMDFSRGVEWELDAHVDARPYAHQTASSIRLAHDGPGWGWFRTYLVADATLAEWDLRGTLQGSLVEDAGSYAPRGGVLETPLDRTASFEGAGTDLTLSTDVTEAPQAFTGIAMTAWGIASPLRDVLGVEPLVGSWSDAPARPCALPVPVPVCPGR